MCTRIKEALNITTIIFLVVNFLLGVLSLLMLVAGGILLGGRDGYDSYLNTMEDRVREDAQTLLSVELDTSNLDVTFITQPIAIALLIFAIITIALVILAFISICGRATKLLFFYSIILALLFMFEVIVVIMSFVTREALENAVKRNLKESLKEYRGLRGQNEVSLAWNAIMSLNDCCGVDDYSDFDVATDWDRDDDANGVVNAAAPFVCCINKTLPSTSPTPDYNLPKCVKIKEIAEHTFGNRGCFTQIWDSVTSESPEYLIFFMTFQFLFKYIALFLAIWIICSEAKYKN